MCLRSMAEILTFTVREYFNVRSNISIFFLIPNRVRPIWLLIVGEFMPVDFGSLNTENDFRGE